MPERLLTSPEAELLLSITGELHSTLDLRVALQRTAPLLQRLVGADHVAIAVSRPGTLYDYEWYNNTLPSSFLGNYDVIAERDFVRRAVAAQPNVAMVDQQMITRKEYDRHIVRQHARSTGANIEHALAVMLCHESSWTSGLSLYRVTARPFDEHDAALLQRVVPHITHAVRNSREHAQLAREPWLEPVLEYAGLAAIWIDEGGREVTRTPRASALLTAYFPAHERRGGALPDALCDYLTRALAHEPVTRLAPLRIERALHALTVQVVALRVHGMWALVLKQEGLPDELAARLPPRLVTIASYLLRGMSNEQIAAKEGRALATIKQQASAVYERLGVSGRKGLLQLATGLSSE